MAVVVCVGAGLGAHCDQLACPPRPPAHLPFPPLPTCPSQQAKRPQLRTWLDQFGEVYSKGVIAATVGMLALLLATGVPLLSAAGQVRLRGRTQDTAVVPAHTDVAHLECLSVSHACRPCLIVCPVVLAARSTLLHMTPPALPTLPAPAPALCSEAPFTGPWACSQSPLPAPW